MQKTELSSVFRNRTSSRGPNTSALSENGVAAFRDGRAKEYIYGIMLTEDNPTHTWNTKDEDEEEGDGDWLDHTLFLRHAVLGPNVPEGERNIVGIKCKDFTKQKVEQPLFSLTSGTMDSMPLDMNFSIDVEVVFQLLQGTGPVYITAQHLIEVPHTLQDLSMTADDDEEEVDDGEEEEEEEEEVPKAIQLAMHKKRKVNDEGGTRKKKSSKVEVSSDEEENMHDEEDEDESMDNEEDDDDEEPEPEPTPEKKKKRSSSKPVVVPEKGSRKTIKKSPKKLKKGK